MKISVQLYSLREEINKEGFGAVLSGLKAADIDGVETVADNYGLAPQKFAALLNKYGLCATGSHTGLAGLKNRAATLERSKALGIKSHIIPWLSPEELKAEFPGKTGNGGKPGLLAGINAEIAFYNASGITIGYHNHAHEFDGGADYIADLLNGAPGLKFEPDIFWLAAAGKSATAYIKPYAKRLIAIHLKELAKGGIKEPNPFFGEGASEIKQCVALAKKLKLECVVIEMEGIAVPWRDYVAKAAEYIRND